MAFDFHFHIPDNSDQGQAIQRMADEQHITPEEAAARLLEEAARLHLHRSPAAQLMGAFSSEEDHELLEDAMSFAKRNRQADLRDFDL